ncbi:MAG: hypothetical protein AAF598_15995 [Bacteroidota bacterium]
MSLKAALLVMLGFVLLPGQDVPLNKIIGIYGKDGVEFVCLELYDNYRFDMTISSCSKDENVQGSFEIQDDRVLLTSDQQAQFRIAKDEVVESGSNGIQLSTKDQNLLAFVTLAINHQKRLYRPDKSGFVSFEGDLQHVQLQFPGLEQVVYNVVSPAPSLAFELEFMHLNAPTMKGQVWQYDKKQLIHTPESGDPVTLRRVKKCWFD